MNMNKRDLIAPIYKITIEVHGNIKTAHIEAEDIPGQEILNPEKEKWQRLKGHVKTFLEINSQPKITSQTVQQMEAESDQQAKEIQEGAKRRGIRVPDKAEAKAMAYLTHLAQLAVCK